MMGLKATDALWYAILGANSSQGREIALALLKGPFAKRITEAEDKCAQLILVCDTLEELASLKQYLRGEMRVWQLNKGVRFDLELLLDTISLTTQIAAAAAAAIVFEALPEDIPLKTTALKLLVDHAPLHQHYLSCGAIVPLWLLDHEAGLQGRVAGWRWYKAGLVELTCLEYGGDLETERYAKEIATSVADEIIEARDFPGAIGNAYFMRELAFACRFVQELEPLLGGAGALYAVNWITEVLLVRGKGIFQMADLIGMRSCAQATTTMEALLGDKSLSNRCLVAMACEATQTPSFFRYSSDGKVAYVFDRESGNYLHCGEKSCQEAIEKLYPLPSCPAPLFLPFEEGDCSHSRYFSNLLAMRDVGASLAAAYLNNCHAISKALIASGSGANEASLTKMLVYGFGYPYSALAPWLTSLLER